LLFLYNFHYYVETPDNISKWHDFFLSSYYHSKVYFRKFISFTPKLQLAIKLEYKKHRKSYSTFIHSAKPNYHSTIPKMKPKHNCGKLRSVLCSLSKRAIHNSEWSDSRGIWKKTHGSIDPPKIIIFQWAKQFQFIRKVTPISGVFIAILFLFSLSFSLNSLAQITP